MCSKQHDKITKMIISAAAQKGFAMGRYTEDFPLTQDVLEILDNSTELMNIYLHHYTEGLEVGLWCKQPD